MDEKNKQENIVALDREDRSEYSRLFRLALIGRRLRRIQNNSMRQYLRSRFLNYNGD